MASETTAMIGFTAEKVHSVTLNTVDFASLIHPCIQPHENDD